MHNFKNTIAVGLVLVISIVLIGVVGGVAGISNGSGTGAGFDPLDQSVLQLSDEFFPGQASIGWRCANVGTGCGASATINGTVGHPGLQNIRTSAASGDMSNWTDGDGGGFTQQWHMGGASNDFTTWEINPIFRTDPSVANYGNFIGFSDGITTFGYGAANAIGVFYDTAAHACTLGTTSTVNFVYITRASGSDNCLDSGIPVTALTYYRIRIVSSVAGTVNFQISTAGGAYSALSANFTAFMPTPVMSRAMQVITRTAAIKMIDVDRWAIKATVVPGR